MSKEDQLRQVLDCGIVAVVPAVVDRGGGFDDGLWKAMAVQGWMGVEVPEAQGGLGMGAVEAAVLLEEVGRHVAPAPFLSSLLAVGALARASASGVAWADRWVEPLVSGEAIGAVVWEPRAPALYAPSADVIGSCDRCPRVTREDSVAAAASWTRLFQ